MLEVESDDPAKELIAFVEAWFDLIASGDIDKACQKIDKPNCYGIQWTPEKLLEIINYNLGPGTGYASDHPEGPKFSKVSETKGNFRVDVLAFDDGSGYSLEYDVPLNGEWSDLTAQFEFIGSGGEFEVVLHDLHVL